MLDLREMFKLLSDENRYKMFLLLMDDHYCVCDIERFLNLKQANVSKHLMAFKKLDVLESWKKHQWTHYRVSPQVLSAYPGLCDDLRHTAMYKQMHHQMLSFEKNRCIRMHSQQLP